MNARVIAPASSSSRGSTRSPSQARSGGPCLLVLNGLDRGEILPLDRSLTVIGKGARADVRVLDHGIGEDHALVRIEHDRVTIERTGGSGPLLVNGESVAGRTPLVDGDRITIGEAGVFRFLHEARARRALSARALGGLRRDARTGLFTPGYLTRRLHLEVDWALDEGKPLALIVFGIDQQAEIAALGHDAADVVFGQVAHAVRSAMRAQDVLSRHDRHCLVAICHGADLEAGRMIAERLRGRVMAQPITFDGRPIGVTLSAGVAALDVDTCSFRELLASADVALFSAQTEGGDRVVCDREPAFGARRSRATRRILFVDDEPQVLEALRSRLRLPLADCEIVWRTSGEAALSDCRRRSFDAVVSDLRMPGLDGLALLRAVREELPGARRVALTGHDVAEAHAVAEVVLCKPCSTDSIIAAIGAGR